MAPSVADLVEDSAVATPTAYAGSQSALYQKLLTGVSDKAGIEVAIREKSLVPLWNTGAPPTALVPHSKHIPAVWKYDTMRSLLLRAAELVDASEAERRAVLMINPGPNHPPFTLDILLAAHQLILPGERAVCHRHTPFAVRFLIEGTSGYTAISGKKMYMKPGDLIITPTWNWHDHGNEGEDNVIWLDGLNIPLFKHIPVDFTEHYIDYYNVETHPSKPATAIESEGMSFPWTAVSARLDAQGGDYASLEYLLPDGQPVSKTIGAYAHRISAGKASASVRETAGNIFQVHSGQGHTELEAPNGEKTTLSWAKGDAFAVPPWYRFHHVAEGDETAYLFGFSDRPLQVNLGFWRGNTL